MTDRLVQLERENATLRRVNAEQAAFIAALRDLMKKLLPDRKRRAYADPDKLMEEYRNAQDRKAPARRRHNPGISVR